MDDIIELELSQAVNVTNTSFIRSTVSRVMRQERLAGPPIELVRFHVFIHCTAGRGRHMVDFEHYEMSRGTAIWVRPGQVQRWGNVDDGFDADVAVFASASLPDLPLFDRVIGTATVTDVGPDTDRLEEQMAWMASDLESSGDQATAAAVVGVILRLFARHARTADTERTTSEQLLAAAFVDSVEAHIEQRSVAWHAKQVGASTRSVARATSAALGRRPKDVIDAHVILEAQRRLAWSDQDISTIARSLQFSEASNFTKFFRSRTGHSPSEFRHAVTSVPQ